MIIAVVVIGFTGGNIRKAHWNSIVNEQKTEDYERTKLCITMKYGEYKKTPKRIKDLEKNKK